jgi:ATP-binding cassette subfamily G (WHITE) protein 2 (PDR)
LLFLATGGKTVYFGEIGKSSRTLTSYFEGHGARMCGEDENPAEWMLEVIDAAPGSETSQDWSAVWRDSEERKAVKIELINMKRKLSQKQALIDDTDPLRPFAASFSTQFRVVLRRVFQQYWRTPSYLYSKVALCLFGVIPIPLCFPRPFF